MEKVQSKEVQAEAGQKTGRVTRVGGVFFRAKGDEKVLSEWYEKNLGMKMMDTKSGMFSILRCPEGGATAWKISEDTSSWFSPSKADFMINYVVDDLDLVYARLKANNAEIIKEPFSDEQGKFLSVMDPEGNRVELWEPKTK